MPINWASIRFEQVETLYEEAFFILLPKWQSQIFLLWSFSSNKSDTQIWKSVTILLLANICERYGNKQLLSLHTSNATEQEQTFTKGKLQPEVFAHWVTLIVMRSEQYLCFVSSCISFLFLSSFFPFQQRNKVLADFIFHSSQSNFAWQVERKESHLIKYLISSHYGTSSQGFVLWLPFFIRVGKREK